MADDVVGGQQKQSPEEGIPEGGPIPLHRDTIRNSVSPEALAVPRRPKEASREKTRPLLLSLILYDSHHIR